MKHYELTYLISQELSEEEAKDLQGKISSLAQEEGGLLGERSLFVKKSLAYPIKKQTQAYLVVLNFQLLPEKLATFENKIKAEKQILRHVLLVKEPKKETPPKRRKVPGITIPKPTADIPIKEKKVELKEIDKKLEEIFKEE